MRRRLGFVFVRSSCTLDQNLGLVSDYAAAYPETHYKKKSALCVVRFVLPPRCVLNLNIAPSVAAKKINIESIAIAIGHRNYHNATAMLSKRPTLIYTHPKVQPVALHCRLATWRILDHPSA